MSLSRRSLLATTTAAVAASAAPAAAASGPGHGGGRTLRTGFDRLAEDGYALLDGRRVGVVTNPTGITRDVRHIVDVMHADDRVALTAVFGPEHGFRGTAQAGGSEGRYDDPATGLPVYDTYLKSGQGLADIFTASGVDTVVFDIQDVGARFYTYIWTLFDCMEAAQLAGLSFVVLDRPNPMTGRAALGPVLHKEFATFVGRQPISQAHGMTVAELALLFNAEFLTTPVPLETVRMSGWKRSDFYDASGLPWVPPSPNMPTPETALVYSGTCLFEGTNLSEGAAPPGRSSCWARRGSTGAGRPRRTSWTCRACASVRRTSRPRSPSSRGRPSGVCSCMCTTGSGSTRCGPASACWSRRSGRGTASPGARTTGSTSSRGPPRCAR